MANEIKYLGADGTSRLVYYIKQRQPMITAVAKLSADLVEDGTTNKVFTATEQTKLSGIASGAQVNVLESVKVNGSALTISSKAVDVLMKSIDSTNTTAQATSSSEAINGSGTINLHKIAKTGTYSDLIGTPTLGTASALDTGTSQGNIPILGSGGKLPSSVVPASAITDTFVASSQASMLALSSAEVGDICVRTDLNKTFILKAEPYSTLANWQELLTPTDAVLSVNGQTGAVSLSSSDVGAVPTTRTVNSKALSSDITLSASDVGAEPAFNKNTAFNQNFETSTSNIKMNGSVSVGSSSNIARADHVHPSDTSKQDTLVSGTNIKTINSNSLLGSGNIDIHDVTQVTSSVNMWELSDGVYFGQVNYFNYKSNTPLETESTIKVFVIITDFGSSSMKAYEAIGTGGTLYYGIADYSTSGSKSYGQIITTTNIVNNLTSTSTSAPLSANQGKVLKDEIDTLPDTAITTTEIDALFS